MITIVCTNSRKLLLRIKSDPHTFVLKFKTADYDFKGEDKIALKLYQT